MKAKYIEREKNDVKFEIEFTAEEFENAQIEVYKKTKDKYEMDGFRKGKAPRSMIEKKYGEGVFMDDAINDLLAVDYGKALKELDIEPIDSPRVEFSQVKKGEGFTATVTVAVPPEVKVKDYTGVKIKDIVHEVTDEDMDKELAAVQERNMRMVDVDRAAKDGDIVNINYAGFVGDEQFEGGTAEDQPLKLGSGQFIPGFEEQVVGAKKGDEVEVKVSFPEEYQSENLAGKDAVFHVKVNGVTEEEKPEINDEFAQDVSEFENLKDYKADLKKKLEEAAASRSEMEKKNAVLEKVFESNEIEIPDVMVEETIDEMMNEFSQSIQQQGMDANEYFKFLGKDPAEFRDGMKEDAHKRVKMRLIVKAVAKEENFEASEEELEKELEMMAQQYQMETDKIKELLGPDQMDMIKSDIKNRKAVDYMFETAVIEQ